MLVKENAAPKAACSVQSAASVCTENFDKSAQLATPLKQSRPRSDKSTTEENLLGLQDTSLPRLSCVTSEQYRTELEREQSSLEEDSWDSVIDGPVSSQLLKQHKMCEDSLLEILNCDTDDLLANI